MASAFAGVAWLVRDHEHLGPLLRHEVFRRPRYFFRNWFFRNWFFRNWNDVIVIAYGVVAFPLALLAIGLAAYVFHTLVDVLPHTDDAIGRLIHGMRIVSRPAPAPVGAKEA